MDAHLVGCARCSAGAATLREEKTRVGQLARVTVDPGSAQLMLEQVGISVRSVADHAPAMPPPPAAPPDARRPWQAGESSPSLPWTPRRPDSPMPVVPEAAVPPIPGDVQPDLPLDGVRAAPPSWDRAEAERLAAEAARAADAISHPSASLPEDETSAADMEWLNATIAPPSAEEPPSPAATPPPSPVAAAPSEIVEPLEPPLPPPIAVGTPPRYCRRRAWHPRQAPRRSGRASVTPSRCVWPCRAEGTQWTTRCRSSAGGRPAVARSFPRGRRN